jgi:glycine betaine/proline transport system substrate-binding protein
VTKKEESENKKEVSIFIPIGLKELFTYLAKVALESDGYDVTLTNLAHYMVNCQKMTQRVMFLDAWLPNTHKDYWADYGEN